MDRQAQSAADRPPLAVDMQFLQVQTGSGGFGAIAEFAKWAAVGLALAHWARHLADDGGRLTAAAGKKPTDMIAGQVMQIECEPGGAKRRHRHKAPAHSRPVAAAPEPEQHHQGAQPPGREPQPEQRQGSSQQNADHQRGHQCHDRSTCAPAGETG